MGGGAFVLLSKLDEQVVKQCRKRHEDGASLRDLTSEHDVDWTTMRAAIRGETWVHVPMP